MTHAVVNKILHAPTTLLKREVSHDQPSLFLDVTRRLFGLDD
jgi:glutamyl-tRNA reductase